MDETINITGHLFAVVEEIDGDTSKIIQVIDSKNQVLNGMLTLVASKLGGLAAAEITKISFGTNTATPTRTDTLATMENVYTKLLTGAPTKPAYNQIKYTFTLEPDEHNGYDITEYALTQSDTVIVCRITRGLVSKTSNIRISGNWTITTDIGA